MTERPAIIAFRDIARSVEFKMHPTLTACWIWQGTFHEGSARVGSTGHSARRDVYIRVIGTEPEGHLRMACGVRACVNPHHTDARA